MACAISIVISLVGYICMSTLPIEQYPSIAPPTVNVTTSYTGADANNKQTPGWMLETQEDSLLVRLDEETSLMKDANFIKMSARQHAIDYLFVRPT